ncbi:NADH dehydrogenase quinone, G subunit [Asticcacaulis biprosthecium C19]|uniref:NADH-quinone oxidoreductase n=1 Tax=Asticcacaulis biprosthecium C19 TaxID=715226 RepID=F4QQX1_9CAUL|nr:NADH-quinone oxidoreductase subunit NuoG [Asticcacaulis biprosthecium]EGF90608.1 NADH dehydrogenase quinone, G subunit [Asticcacaulis biprosthecium C19]
MPKAKVNGVEVEFDPGMTVLQVAELAGEEIPRFCYHERLSIAGNCRMCLVEVKPGPPKPQASCALPAADNQEIFTNTPMVKKAREGVMEFLLINHPLDCPICDQGGECDLQDQSVAYGKGASRYGENKRAVEEKYLGPTIKTFMTRCIQCTRCVRFTTEVAGVTEMGMISRGEGAEITSYLEQAVTSELSGNVNDLCPVGALTHKPWSFNYRPWELTKTETIDVHDALGAHIRIDNRGPAVLRALPRLKEDVNEEWLTDKSRYAVDGLSRKRLDRPYVRKGGKLEPVSWDEALTAVAGKLNTTPKNKIGVIAGDLVDAETMKAAKDLFYAMGVTNLDCRQDGAKVGPVTQSTPRESWLFNSGIAGIENADAILIVGSDLRFEASLINTRIRKTWLRNAVQVGVIGQAVDLTYDYTHVGVGPKALKDFKKNAFRDVMKNAQRPAILVGSGAVAGDDGAAVLREVAEIADACGVVKDGWNGFNIVHAAASRVAGLDLGFVPVGEAIDATAMLKGAVDTLVLLGADEFDASGLDKTFVVYIGSHGDKGAATADVILPGAAYTEKSGIYTNLEGRVQIAERCVFPKGEAKEDWAILRALSDKVGQTLPYDSLAQLREKLITDHPVFGRIDVKPATRTFDLKAVGAKGDIKDRVFMSPIVDFYMTNPIARASVAMAECSAARGAHLKAAAE